MTSILKIKQIVYITLCLLFIPVACNGGPMNNQTILYKRISDVPESAWEKMFMKKIFFGHQSVGFNILDGVQDLIKKYPQIKLNIVETSMLKNIPGGIFAHARVGQNTHPKSKIDDFAKIVEQESDLKINIAALKFCYVDIKGNTDVKSMFNDYKNTVLKIKKTNPDLTIIHFTAPLTTSKSTWKTWVKQKLGKASWEFSGNIKRNQYNELLIKEYQGNEPIFDMAKIESTRPDGSRQSFEQDGVIYFSLVPEYTNDGGHLNEKGREKVAEELILLLANLK